MGVERDYHAIAVFEILVHIFDLACVNVGHRDLHGHRQVNDDLFIGGRLPDVKHRIAYFKGELGLGACEGLGGILEAVIHSHFLADLIEELCSLHRDIDDLLLGLFENLLSLRNRGGIIEMDDRIFYTLEAFKGLFDYMLSRLRKHLHGYVIGNKILLHKGAEEGIFGLACRGKSDLYLLKSDFYQQFEEFKLFLKAHRDHQRLISVAKIHGTPHRGLCEIILLYPLRLAYGSGKILSCVLVCVHILTFLTLTLSLRKSISLARSANITPRSGISLSRSENITFGKAEHHFITAPWSAPLTKRA